MAPREAPYSIGWFSTGRGEGSRGLLTAALEAIRSDYLPASIAFVFCNRERGEHEGSDKFMELVQSYGLPLITLSSRRFRRERGAHSFAQVREEYDHEVMRRIDGFEPELCVLAGYMLFTAPELCQRFPLLNLHPGAPGGPMGTWQEVIWQLIDQRAQEAGAQIHLATEEWDRGPTVAYCGFPLHGPTFDPCWKQVGERSAAQLRAEEGEENPLFRAIRAEGVRREVPLLLTALRAFAQGRLRVVELRVVDAEGMVIPGYDMTREIEEKIRA